MEVFYLYKKLTILVDVDNVLEDLVTPWIAALNKKYNRGIKPSDITAWNIETFYEGLSRNQVYSPLHTKELWDSLVPLQDSQKYIKKLKEDGHNVILVTSAHPDTIPYKISFLKKYFPEIPFKDIIITSHKQMVIGDVLIDDAPHNLEGGNYLGLLFSYPHNKEYNTVGKNIKRVNNWKEIYNIIKNL